MSDEVQADAAEQADEVSASTLVSTGEDDASAIAGSEDSVATGEDDVAAVVEESSLDAAALAPASDSVLASLPQVSGWVLEGDSWCYYDADGSKYTGWLVTGEAPGDSGAGLQRYWLDSEGRLAVGRLISSEEAGWWAYATDAGYVVRGSYADGSGAVYLADNDGVLAGGESGGWVVSSAYGQGLQRYWIGDSTHAAVEGFSTDGWAHYTTSAGYVLRGAATTSDGAMRIANNDGLLQESGWCVTTGFGQGLQRYWFEGYQVAKGQLVHVSQGIWTYARPEGYVVRGSYSDGSGSIYLADNDGVLAGGESGGWVVSAAYGQGLQRYWIDGSAHAAKAGYSGDGWSHYTTGQGYVLRGAATIDGRKVYADNDGAFKTGWLVTSGFGQGLQRYWLDEGKVATSRLVSAAEAGYNAYAQADGRILRGKLRYGDGMLVADNNGRLAWTSGDGGWVITADYDGSMQRYWVDDSPGDGLMGAHIGAFTVAGQNYYGRDDQGYVVRGEWAAPNGTVYYGDNDGVVTEGQPIMGASRHTVAQMVAYYKATGKAYPSAALGRGGASSIETFCAILCEEAAAEGVRAEVVFAQAMLETAWLQFGGDVRVEQFNFAGIGATGGGVPGNSFADVRTGLRAQVQHLKAYASTDALNNSCVDPRFSYVSRGCAPTIEKLSNKWAASSTYGEDMKRVLNGLSSY
ncbi:MAG: glucosaminidase domain-containing protein [Coriobacteriia bacterium]|nr:glucosaminidase domain-containing protein [Coriobacteriia bacterium]